MKNFILGAIVFLTAFFIVARFSYWVGYNMRSLESYKDAPISSEQVENYTRYMLKQCLLKQQEL